MDNGRTRRWFIVGGTSSVLAVVGLNEFASGLLGGPEFASAYTTNQLTEPLVDGGPSPENGPPYFATVITEQERAVESIHWNRFPETQVDRWQDINYDEEFLAVFISRYRVTPSGTAQGDRPGSRVDGDTFTFSLDGEVGPFRFGDKLFTRIERWKLNGSKPPERATVELEFE